MRVSEREHDLPPLHLCAVADPDDVELALEALGHALHRVGHQRAREPVELPQLPVIPRERRLDLAVRDLER